MKFSNSFYTIFFVLIGLSRAHTPGTVTVDTLTFDKIIRNFDVVLAKFDEKYRMYYCSKSSYINLNLLFLLFF